MNDFHEALTYRWQETITDMITNARRDGFPRNRQPTWDYLSEAALQHVRGYCTFVHWVQGGQQDDLNAVSCQGKLPPSASGASPDGGAVIDCGMGKVLKSVEDWAWAEREDVYAKLPLFDMHDLSVLEEAHNAFLDVGGQLGLDAAAGSTQTSKSFMPMDERELVGKVEDLSGARGRGQDWWAGWTGLAASRAKAGFFDSVIPSLNNQSGIIGSLANLYAARAAIIEKGRNDALYWIQWATKSLKETQTISTNLVAGWKTVQGIGTAITIPGGWIPVAGAIGASVTLVGFIGENLISKITTEVYKYDLIEVVEQLNDKIVELVSTIGLLESEYGMKVGELEDTIYGIHSYNLELYDLTRTDPHGDDQAPKEGYTANIDDILKIGQACYEAGDLYAGLLPVVAGTLEADRHLADRDGRPNQADRSLVETRILLEEFLKTTCGRYLAAGDQVVAAAAAYAQTDAEKKAAFDRIMADWQKASVASHDQMLEGYAGETERPDRGDSPSPGSSNRSPSAAPAPGFGDGEEYETQ
ncbi:MAG TPA: hypothetical protein VFC19_54405 [Candidatus Limnocylindrales bacterium]|nr:hypothetical protein [Candidatus Limnocylindrales bacterium]